MKTKALQAEVRARRVLVDVPPFQDDLGYSPTEPWHAVPSWPASWIVPPEPWETPWVAAFRCVFDLKKEIRERFHVTADERYELYLDGARIGGGPERGDANGWHYETYALSLPAGRHVLVARVWALGGRAPWAQVSVAPGFFCCPEGATAVAAAATGVAPWEVLRLHDRAFPDMGETIGALMGAGPSEVYDARRTPPDLERGGGDPERWQSVRRGEAGRHGARPDATRILHWLRPALLPAPLAQPWHRFGIEETDGAATAADWLGLLEKGTPLRLPAGARAAATFDLGDYLCAYPELGWNGGEGGTIRVGWAEALRDARGKKVRGPDAALRGGRFFGPFDSIRSAGGAGHWRPLWWRCGTRVRIEAEAGPEPLTLERLTLVETRHPLRVEAKWKAPDPEWDPIFAVGRRTLEMCLHETFMDCPYYEQLMYVGDTRIQCLLAYALARDDRPQRKAIALFDSSRANPTGLVAANHPSRGSQLIAPFALWWIAMVRDFALWRGDAAFVRERLPGVRTVVDFFAARIDREGLLRAPEGWNFFDSAYRPGGVPPGAVPGGRSAVFQAQWALVLRMAGELEACVGEPEHAARCRRLRGEAVRALVAAFWNEERGLLADRPGVECKAEPDAAVSYSEHAQYLALLAGALPVPKQARVWRALGNGAVGLLGTSCYFSHYAFEACLAAGRADLFAARLGPWKEGLRKGFRTTPENFGETRSDCHAWSANPLFHYLSGILGIRPGKWGFGSVLIEPCIAGIEGEASGTLAHPLGPVRVLLERRREKVRAEVFLPPKLGGVFRFGAEEYALRPGRQRIDLFRSAPSSGGVHDEDGPFVSG